MLVLFENLTPVCMSVIEVIQSSIDSSRMRSISIPKTLGGAVLVSRTCDCDRSIRNCILLLEDHTLYWSGGGAGSLPHVDCRALSVICD